jgi:hypothetical protein
MWILVPIFEVATPQIKSEITIYQFRYLVLNLESIDFRSSSTLMSVHYWIEGDVHRDNIKTNHK